MGGITIHSNPGIKWHRERAEWFKGGLERLGFTVSMTQSTTRINHHPAVLFGTSGFKAVEADRGHWLLVDRACWGDPGYVRLGWDARGIEANYCVPDYFADRPRWIPAIKKHNPGKKVILCGDYDDTPVVTPEITHFKPHPHAPVNTTLPLVDNFDDCKLAVVGNSTVAFDCIFAGIPVDIRSKASIARMPLEFLSWTQWAWSEIADGEAIRHIFKGYL